MDLTGHTALITGAGRQLGKAIAEALVCRGAKVAVHFHASDAGAREVLALAEEHGTQAALVSADLADLAAVENLFSRAVDAIGEIDWLVNNASIFEPLGVADTSLDDWHRHMAINLTAPFLLSQALVTNRGERPGAILNMLDYRATHPGPDHFPYTINKAGLAAMTKSMAQAVAPHIRVNGLALGNILPPVDDPHEQPKFRRTPMKRRGTEAEVVESAVFLLNGPAFITGEILYLDGGRHLT